MFFDSQWQNKKVRKKQNSKHSHSHSPMTGLGGPGGPGRPAVNFQFFFGFFFGPQNSLKLPPGPRGALGAIFGIFLAYFGALGGPGGEFFFRALGPYFPYPGLCPILPLSGAIFT